MGDASTVQSVAVEPNFGGSDHRVVSCEIQCPVPKITFAKKKIRLYSKGDYVALNDEVKNFDWNSYLNSKCIETNWSRFKRKYEELLDKYVPFKLVQIGQRHKPPWGNYRSIAKAKVNRRKAKIHAEKTGLVADKILYEDAQDHVNVTITQAKGHYEDKLVEELNTNPKRFWNYTRHFSRSTSTIDFLHDCGERISDDTKKAELLNDFFASVLTDESDINKSEMPDLGENVDSVLKDISWDPEDVRFKLIQLKADKAAGPDLVSVNVLRNCPDFDTPLCILFNQSMQTGMVPQDWRDANITPLHKKGPRSCKKNYRPVSLTSQVVKIMERLIQDSILSILRENKTISCHQHGFQAGCLCYPVVIMLV